MMDSMDMMVFIALISPVYIALFGIYQKIGKYDETYIALMKHIAEEKNAY
jgi:hypothetical protein